MSTLIGRSVGFNPDTGGIDLDMSAEFGAGLRALGALDKDIAFLNQHLTKMQAEATLKGQTHAAAGIDNSADESFLTRKAYRHGQAYQTTVAESQVMLQRFGAEYEQARLRGASEEELGQIRQNFLQGNVELIDNTQTNRELQEDLREGFLKNLSTVVKLQQQADKRATDRQYDEAKTTIGISTWNNLKAHVAANNAQGIRNELQHYVNTQVRLERSQGNDDKAYEVANKQMPLLIKTFIDNVDMENAQDVATLNTLMAFDYQQIQGLNLETFEEIQGVIEQARVKANNVMFSRTQFDIENLAAAVESGTIEFTPEIAKQRLNQILSNPNMTSSQRVKVLSDFNQIVKRQHDKEQQLRQSSAYEKLLESTKVDLANTTYMQALAMGKGTDWINFKKESAFQKSGGSYAAAGFELIRGGVGENSDALLKAGAEMLSNGFAQAMRVNTAESFAKMEGNGAVEAEFQRFKEIYLSYQNNPRMQEHILAGVPDDIRNTVYESLNGVQGRSMNMSSVLSRHDFAKKSTNGETRQASTEALKDFDAKQFRKGRLGGIAGTSSIQQQIGDMNVGNARLVARAAMPELLAKGKTLPTSAPAWAATLRNLGLVFDAGNGVNVVSPAHRDMMFQATGGHGIDSISAFISHITGGDTDMYVDAVSVNGVINVFDLSKDQTKPVRSFNAGSFKAAYDKWYIDQRAPNKPVTTDSNVSNWISVMGEVDARTKRERQRIQAEQAKATQRIAQRKAAAQNPSTARRITASNAQSAARQVNLQKVQQMKAQVAPKPPVQSKRDTRNTILNQEIANEQKALDELQKQPKSAKRDQQIAERQANIAAIKRELSR